MRLPRAVALPYSVRLGGPHPLKFGVGRRWLLEWAEKMPRALGDDMRLFATAYALGFAGFTLFIA